MTSSLVEVKHGFVPYEGFNTRLSIEHQLFQEIREKGEDWPCKFGYYGGCENSLLNYLLLPGNIHNTLLDNGESLPTFHTALRIFINNLNNAKSGGSPTVLLDIGGGFGSTWAKHAAIFREEILASKIAFVVSNLSEALGRRNCDCEGSELVHYISAPFRKLCSQTITLPNGQILSLRGNVDLAHESQSLTRWSQVPELDILSVYGLLSNYGSYFIAPPNKPCRYDNLSCIEASQENQFQRSIAVNQALSLLKYRYGLTHVTHIENGKYQGAGLMYQIYRKPQSPLIEI